MRFEVGLLRQGSIIPPVLCLAYYHHRHPEHDHRIDWMEGGQYWPAQASCHFNQGPPAPRTEERVSRLSKTIEQGTFQRRRGAAKDRDGIEPTPSLNMDCPPRGIGEDAQACQERLYHDTQRKKPGDEDIQEVPGPIERSCVQREACFLGIHGRFLYIPCMHSDCLHLLNCDEECCGNLPVR